MTIKKNLASLSKSNKTNKQSNGSKIVKPTINKNDNSTTLSDREIKAKETVNRLLEDVSLLKGVTDKELVSVDVNKKNVETKGIDWLEEQLQILTERNEFLENENQKIKADYFKIFNEHKSQITTSNPNENDMVIRLFNELQDNYILLGDNFRVYFPAFLNRMVMFFPYLRNYRKY